MFSGVTKLQGFWGMSSAGIVGMMLVLIPRLWQREIYVCDSKVLHHLVVKDQLVYEQQRWILQYAFQIFVPSWL